MWRVVAAARLLVQKTELARRFIDGMRAHFRTVAVRGVEKTLLAVERDIARIGQGFKYLDQCPCAAVLIHAIKADSFSTRLAMRGGKTSDIRQHVDCSSRLN